MVTVVRVAGSQVLADAALSGRFGHVEIIAPSVPTPRDAPSRPAEPYIRYSDAAMPIVERHGGRLLYSGIVGAKAHEDDAPEWDYVVLVEYPGLQAFVDIVTDPDYQAAHADRTGSVERALLRMTHPLDE